MVQLKAILDASPIIAFFDELEMPDILLLTCRLGYELLVPFHVQRFDIVKEPSKTMLAKCIKDGVISTLPPLDPARVEDFMNAHPSLGAGESEVILHAIDLRTAEIDVVCVLDERTARRAANQLGLPLVGTIGLISALSKANLIDVFKAGQLKNRLEDSKFRIDRRLLR